MCSIKKLFLKILQYPHETPVLESLFKKVAGLKFCSFIKKRPQHRCFPVNIAKLKRPSISKNIGCFLTVLMVHCYMGFKFQGLDHMMASGFRVQVFLFLSQHLLSWTEFRPAFEKWRQIPLMSQLSFDIGYFCCFRSF